MMGKDLRLPIDRRVIAIYADEDMCEQRRDCKTAGDRSFWCCHLCHLVADAAGIFLTRNTDHAKLGRHPVQHLKFTLSDAMNYTSGIRD